MLTWRCQHDDENMAAETQGDVADGLLSRDAVGWDETKELGTASCQGTMMLHETLQPPVWRWSQGDRQRSSWIHGDRMGYREARDLGQACVASVGDPKPGLS